MRSVSSREKIRSGPQLPESGGDNLGRHFDSDDGEIMAPISTRGRVCEPVSRADGSAIQNGTAARSAAPVPGAVRGNLGVCSPDDITYVPLPVVQPGNNGLFTPSMHTVRPGETLWTIAKSDLGDARLWRWLAEINGLDVGKPIFAGMRLRTNPLVPDWEVILHVPVAVARPVPGGSDKFAPPEASIAARSVGHPTVVFALGEGEGSGAGLKLDGDLSLLEDLRPGLKKWTEFPEFPLGPFLVTVKLKGSIKVTKTGASPQVTFTGIGIESEAKGVANDLFGGGLDTLKLRYDPVKKQLSFGLGDKIKWGPADFSVDFDLIERAVKFSGAVKAVKIPLSGYDVEPKIGVEIKIKKRNKSLPTDKKDAEEEEDTMPQEASVAAALAVAIPVAFVVGSAVAASGVVAAAGEVAVEFGVAARALGVHLPRLVRLVGAAAH